MEFSLFWNYMLPIFETMQLIERDDSLSSLRAGFKKASSGEGHCFFIMGEAGIGKTSLVRAFLKETDTQSTHFVGACDSLFTPRPLAPLYDLASQINHEWVSEIQNSSSKSELFTRFVHHLTSSLRPAVVVFEDIHWADEATLDFIKFFARRISRSNCLFILTMREEEIGQQHAVRNVFADLPPHTFTRLQLTPLSKMAVRMLADGSGYDGEDVYSISGGNPFYVSEILAGYSLGVPDNIKDLVLSVYNRLGEETKDIWQLLSVVPEGLELNHLYQIDPSYHRAIDNCLENKILIVENNKIAFKHELYRRTIESSLSPFRRISLNKTILDLLLTSFEAKGEIERIVHYAKNANENKLVEQYAPIAARQAASVGSHIEACKLFLAAIEYSDGTDANRLVGFYEGYAYECYLTNQIKDAIIYQGKALKIWKEKNEIEKIGNSLRFLSRLWWFEGNRQKAESFGREAIEILNQQPSSKAKAMAFSNMSLLKMLSDQTGECIFWGEKAITIALEVEDEETLAHALNSMGSTLMLNQSSAKKGIELLQRSLEISVRNGYHEHVARAYTALGSNAVTMKDYSFAEANLEQGINYCEEKDLDSLKFYMLSWRARLSLETGNWAQASEIANSLLEKENLLPVIKIGALVVMATIKMRNGEPEALSLLMEAKTWAFRTAELRRIIPVLVALLEYEWLTGKCYVENETLHEITNLFIHAEKIPKKSRFFFWICKMNKQYPDIPDKNVGLKNSKACLEEANTWKKIGCPYEHSLALFNGNEDDKRMALSKIQQLGATAVYEKMKMEMRLAGIRKIPRGQRESTRSNPAQLTNRELEVLRLLRRGVQNKEIAQELFISPKTVDHHISSILFKLDVNSRLKAVHEAARLGIVK